MKLTRILLLTILAGFGAQCVATAGTLFTDESAFKAASSTTVKATFEEFSKTQDTPNISNPYTINGVTFSAANLYVAAPNGGVVQRGDLEYPITSNVLTVTGNDDITAAFSGSLPTAVGLSIITNRYAPPTIYFYDGSNNLLASFTLTQAPNTLGYVGFTSTVPIGSFRFIDINGQIKDSCIDNISTGVIPEPSTWMLLSAGFAISVLIAKRKKRVLSLNGLSLDS